MLPTSIFPICGAFWMDSFSHGSGHKVFLQRKCVTSAYIHVVEGLGIPIRKHVVGERRCWEVNALKILWCYFRVHQLNKTFCLSQTDLRKNLPLTFFDQITCISQDWHFPMGSISWMANWSSDWKGKDSDRKRIASCDFFYMKNWSNVLSSWPKHSLMSCPMPCYPPKVRSSSLSSHQGTRRSQLQNCGQTSASHTQKIR